jgi:hypothetical protein
LRAGSGTVAWGKEEELCSDERTAIDELIGRSVEGVAPEGSNLKQKGLHNL